MDNRCTEFKYGTGTDDGRVGEMHLNVILDLFSHNSISYVLRVYNDNSIVYDTFDMALTAKPGVQPIFRSERRNQYIKKYFSKIQIGVSR